MIYTEHELRAKLAASELRHAAYATIQERAAPDDRLTVVTYGMCCAVEERVQRQLMNMILTGSPHDPNGGTE